VGRRGLGDDEMVDKVGVGVGVGVDDGLGVFAGRRSTAVAGLLLLFTNGGAAESLIEHFSVWTSRLPPGRVPTEREEAAQE
jgi:hypothetical protein